MESDPWRTGSEKPEFIKYDPFQGNIKHCIQARKIGSLSWEFRLRGKAGFSLSLDGWMVPTGTKNRKNKWEGRGNALRAQASEENQTQNPNGMPTLVPSLPDAWPGSMKWAWMWVPWNGPVFLMRSNLLFDSSRILVAYTRNIPK